MPHIMSAWNEQNARLGRFLFFTLLCALWAGIALAQQFQTLAVFEQGNGAYPYSSLIQGNDGNFYGTTVFGGANNCGTFFKITSNGNLTTLHSFAQAEGCGVYGTLILTTDGNFYGTTAGGATHGDGTVFRASPNGVVTTLHSFCSYVNCADGSDPTAGLFEASDGNLYGTTRDGGANCPQSNDGCGTIFRITKAGALTVLRSFNGSDGYYPQAALIQAGDGMLYGVAASGGDFQCLAPYGCGTIFRLSLAGDAFTVLHRFAGDDGNQPWSRLTQAKDGDLYGTTTSGGQYNWGTIFKIDLSGKLTSLHSFNFTDGGNPFAGLIQATVVHPARTGHDYKL